LRLPDFGRKDIFTCVRHIQATDLTNIDEEAHTVALVPVSTVVAVMTVLVVMVLPIIKAILVLVPLMSAPIIRP
jgi:hypothetical protein